MMANFDACVRWWMESVKEKGERSKVLGRVGKRKARPNAVSVMEIVSHADDNTNSGFNLGDGAGIASAETCRTIKHERDEIWRWQAERKKTAFFLHAIKESAQGLRNPEAKRCARKLPSKFRAPCKLFVG